MKHFYFAIFLLFASLIKSQTLTQNFHEPKPGDSEEYTSLDTSAYATGMPINISGSNKMWDFSKLTYQYQPYQRSIDSPSTVPNATAYPSATMVQAEPGLTIFLKSTTSPTTQTEVLGISSAFFNTTFTNSAIAAVFPISLNTTNTDNFSGTLTAAFNGTNISGNCNGKITYTADGTGTVTLANGVVYKNVIRIKTIQTLTVTQGFFPLGSQKQTTYDYYDVSEKSPVLSISYQSLAFALGTPSVTGGASGTTKVFVGLNEQTNNPNLFTLFPNPAKDLVTISNMQYGASDLSVSVYNSLGQIVLNLNPQTTQHSVSIDISSLPSGIYQIKYENGQLSGSRKLIVE